MIKATSCKPVGTKNQFVVEVTFMHGDADGYTTTEIPVGISLNNAEAALVYFTAHIGQNHYNISPFRGLVPHNLVYGHEHSAYTEAVSLYWYNSEGGICEVDYEID